MMNQAATEYRNVPLTALEESKTNPRRVFDETALKELAAFVPGHKIGFLWR
jgi:ParB family chromosome partitioning protein